MGNVTIKKIEYKGWKNCISISNGIIDLVATTDVGPRIISFGFTGGVNEFCEVQDQIGKTGGNEWNIYGGHRLWHSPEAKPRSYEPDNDKIEWKKKKNGIVLTQPVETWAKIQKEIEISVSPQKAEVTLNHRLTNKSAWDVELSVWALTVVATGGTEIIPQVLRETGLLPNRMLSLWPYTKLNDNRVNFGDKYILLKQDKNAVGPFKIGLPNEDGWAAYANNNHLFVKNYNHIKGMMYPDYASSYETYTCDFMLEMESLSPLVLLEPEQTVEHTEVWNLYDNVKLPKNDADVEKNIIPLFCK